jgi:threonine dehydrogenase-like Zn-dependent dehydrogenase
MVTNRILFTEPCVAKLVEEELTAPAAGQAQVKIEVSTISSGTERANLIGDVNINSTKPAAAEAKFPRSGGYSSAGTVVAVGEGVTDLKPGDRVAVFWSKHGTYMNVSVKDLLKLPDDVPFEEAALWNIATFPLAAIRKCRLEMGESAIVMGQGVLGQMAVMELRAAGAVPIIAVDPVEQKRQQALQIGADFALDPFDPDFAQQVKEITGGGAQVAIEVTGVGAGLNGVLDCMRPRGRVALLGCTRNSDFTVDYYRKVHGPGITLIGAHTQARPPVDSAPGWWTEADDRKCLMNLYRFGRLRLSALVEETHSPKECFEVYSRLATEKCFPLVQFDWRTM